MANHYREMFYNHAHAAVWYIFRLVQDKQVVYDAVDERFDNVVLSKTASSS